MITRVMLGSGCNPVDLQALHIDKDRDKALLSRASLYVGQQSSRAAAEDLSSQEPSRGTPLCSDCCLGPRTGHGGQHLCGKPAQAAVSEVLLLPPAPQTEQPWG